MVKQKITVCKMFEANRNVKIVQHETAEKLLAAEWRAPIEGLELCNYGGIDENGNMWETSFSEMIKSIKHMECYGFTDDKANIHIWISKKADSADVINLLAHERGHLIKPNHRDLIKEEMKAEIYGLCAEFAYRTFLNLTMK
jgi:hypothetical protein